MAILNNQGLSGSIGEVSIHQRNGKTVVRKKKNNKSSSGRSEAQRRNELRFSVSQAWVKPMLEFVKVGFRKYEDYQYPGNAAKAYIKGNALREEAGTFTVDPALARVSMGPLTNPQDLQVSVNGEQMLEFSWNPALERNMSPRDRVMMLAYNSEVGHAVYSLNGPYRMNGAANLDVPRLGSGKCLVYVAFLSENGKTQSESVYLGEVEL